MAPIVTHPDAQLHILSTVHLHPFIQQTNLLKVKPVHHEAANQSGAPGGLKTMKIGFVPHTGSVGPGSVAMVTEESRGERDLAHLLISSEMLHEITL